MRRYADVNPTAKGFIGGSYVLGFILLYWPFGTLGFSPRVLFPAVFFSTPLNDLSERWINFGIDGLRAMTSE